MIERFDFLFKTKLMFLHKSLPAMLEKVKSCERNFSWFRVPPSLPLKSHGLSLIDAFSKSGGTERNNHHRMMAPPRPTQGCGSVVRIMCMGCDEDFV
ncbi:hypothetical protein TNCT_60401 [Trichonephila clavata]|uniref:Uncharacterized protein n=1 Tax=Trichonephila clavata TaxID=2740835 RepID=A0A8X6G855_TRICU|nr:hypothetical protein TNCT_60401 [Trichonephila clavata]